MTGASSGIGECLAYDLARAGCKLILSSPERAKLERVKENCIGKLLLTYIKMKRLYCTSIVEHQAKSETLLEWT